MTANDGEELSGAAERIRTSDPRITNARVGLVFVAEIPILLHGCCIDFFALCSTVSQTGLNPNVCSPPIMDESRRVAE